MPRGGHKRVFLASEIERMRACARGETKFDAVMRELRTGKKTLQNAMIAAGIVLQRGRRRKPGQAKLSHPPAPQPGDAHYADGPAIADFQQLTVNTLGTDPYLRMLRRVHPGGPRNEVYEPLRQQQLQQMKKLVRGVQRRLQTVTS